MGLQQIPFVATLVETHAELEKHDAVILRLIQLEHLHIAALIDRTGAKRKLVGRDGKQRLDHLADIYLVEVLNVLRGQQHSFCGQIIRVNINRSHLHEIKKALEVFFKS